MTWKAPFTINSHTPPSSSSPNPDLETDSPLSLPDRLALAGPIRSPQDLASNELPGSSRPLRTDWGQPYSFSASFLAAKSPPALFCLSLIIFGFPHFGGRRSQEVFFAFSLFIVILIMHLKITPNSQFSSVIVFLFSPSSHAF